MFRNIALFITIFISLFASCTTRQESWSNSGLFGEHLLNKMETTNTIQASASGSFFLGCGDIESSFGSESKIKFYWSPKPNEIVASTLLYSKFRFIIDETKSTPTVEFIFQRSWLQRDVKIVYDESSYPNLNDFVMSNNMLLAKVRISTATLEKEVYLPKIQ